jgi:hypothetical protein
LGGAVVVVAAVAGVDDRHHCRDDGGGDDSNVVLVIVVPMTIIMDIGRRQPLRVAPSWDRWAAVGHPAEGRKVVARRDADVTRDEAHGSIDSAKIACVDR